MNRWRSPTAEQIFSELSGVDCASAGINKGAENPVTAELLDWADQIFVMGRIHKTRLSRDFKPQLKGKRIVCLDIPDKYKFMDPTLVKLLRTKVDGSLLHR